MGAYYNISNETKRVWIDPGKVGGGANKLYGAVNNCGPLLMFLMAMDWHGDKVSINCDEADPWANWCGGERPTYGFSYVEKHFRDVTKECVDQFNRHFSATLAYLEDG